MSDLARGGSDVLSVLLVDDDVLFCRGFARALAPMGLRVRIANDFDGGLAEIRREPADLVVLDLLLKEESGLDLLKHVRALAPSARVVVATGAPSVETAVAAVRLGARHYLPKPFDVMTLLGAFFGEVDTHPAIESATNVVELEARDPPSLDKQNRDYIERMLAECGGNVSHAAQKLGLHRRSLQRMLKKSPPSK